MDYLRQVGGGSESNNQHFSLILKIKKFNNFQDTNKNTNKKRGLSVFRWCYLMRESKMIDVDSIVKGLEELVYQDLISIYGKKIASNCSEAMLNCLWLNFRKVYLYVPTSDGREIQARNMAIWKEFNGKNHAYLAVKHRLSVQRIYAIIKIMRAEFSDNENSQAKNRPLLLWVIDEYMTADFIQCGLSTENAKATAQRVADHLCENFPGVSIRITDYIKASREAAFMLALP